MFLDILLQLTQSYSARPSTSLKPGHYSSPDGAGGNGVPGNRRVVQADRRPGESFGQLHRSASSRVGDGRTRCAGSADPPATGASVRLRAAYA